MDGRKPTKAEAEFMARAVELGCIVCLEHYETYSPAEFHHIDGRKKEGCHFHGLPLCYLHHREGSDCTEYTSRHPHKAKFEIRYGKELDLYHKLLDILDT